MKTETARIQELRRLARAAGGLLLPETVVEAARPETSPLHSAFCWDDTEAAHNYRLWQARQLLRVTVIYSDNGPERFPVFVSLTTDRKDGDGYREMVKVLTSENMRDQMLADALAELEAFQKKYEMLKELVEVFESAKKVRSRSRALAVA